jgi:hypothetical protein
MKRFLFAAGVILVAAAAAQAVPTDVTYTEGDATTRFTSGKQQDTAIGDVLNTGDSVKTGADGQVELNQKGVTVKVSHGTVFTLMEREQNGQKAPVLSVALGSIKFRYGKLTGQEPLIRTNSAVMGVRGTEFTVFSGADGSTLIAVDSGQVTVQAEGKSVELASAEGVEVPLGQAPGDKFVVHTDKVDFSKWNEDKLGAMLADPLTAMTNLEAAMAQYVRSLADFDATYTEYKQRLQQVREDRAKIAKEKGAEESTKYYNDVELPLSLQTGYVGLNVRYFALAALSLRRFVGGRLYVVLKAHYITNPHDTTWTDFLTRYNEFLAAFEQTVVPQLVPVDI